MRTFMLLILILSLSALALTCKKKPTEPPNGGPDTTSHSFTFVLDTLGDGNSSVLNDVAIISENNVWAVGEIYKRDSTGQFETQPYNAVRWDGNRWHYVRIPTRIFGTSRFMYAPLKALWAFGPTSIVVTTGGQVIWYDGQSWGRWEFLFTSLNDTTFGGINRFWAKGSNALWGAGNKGNIFLFNGSTWQKLESGTTVDIQDIYGAVDVRTGQTEILAVASFQNYGQGLDLLRIVGTTVMRLDTSGLRRSQSSVWFIPGIRYYVAGDGLFWKDDLNAARWEIDTAQPNYFKRRARGNTAHDVFVVGDFGLASHFNGSTWRHYTGVEFPQFFGSLVSVATRGDQVVGVGEISDRAIVLRGRRTH